MSWLTSCTDTQCVGQVYECLNVTSNLQPGTQHVTAVAVMCRHPWAACRFADVKHAKQLTKCSHGRCPQIRISTACKCIAYIAQVSVLHWQQLSQTAMIGRAYLLSYSRETLLRKHVLGCWF